MTLFRGIESRRDRKNERDLRDFIAGNVIERRLDIDFDVCSVVVPIENDSNDSRFDLAAVHTLVSIV